MDSETPLLPITVCQIPGCLKTLGAESRDAEYPVCHEHRKCSKCNQDVQAAESQYCLDMGIEKIVHARCRALEMPELDKELDTLNLARLLIWPDPTVSRDTNNHTTATRFNHAISRLQHDEILIMLGKAQTLAAACSLALSKNRREIEEEINDREKNRHSSAMQNARQNNLTPSDKKHKSAEEKSIQTFMALGMTKEQATEMHKAAKAARRES